MKVPQLEKFILDQVMPQPIATIYFLPHLNIAQDYKKQLVRE